MASSTAFSDGLNPRARSRIEVAIDGKLLLTAQDDSLKSGGAGIYVDHGCAGFDRFAVKAQTTAF